MNEKITPFCKSDTFSTFRSHMDSIISEIDSLDNEYVLKVSPTELEEYYLEKAMINPLELDSANYYIENQKGIKKEVHHYAFNERYKVQGTQLDIAIPYIGDSQLWQIRPSTYFISGYPEITVLNDKIILSISFVDQNADAEIIKNEIESSIKKLTDSVSNLKIDILAHNNSAIVNIKKSIDAKRQKANNALNVVSSLGIPIKRTDKPLTFIVPTNRRISPISKPKVPHESKIQEPRLDIEEYKHILEILKSMSLVIERSPASFKNLDEEAIRTHFLLQLNGHYEGSATGETFNAVGKTDILIRVDNRNIFIAECKFWHGPKGFSDAIDQLLSYLSWRDSKCALLIFNKNKDSSLVRDKMNEIMIRREEYKKTFYHNANGDSQYMFISKNDQGREIIITTLLFDFPGNG